MLQSMTGYGTAVVEENNTRIAVEIKSLNSKFLDSSIRLPKIFSNKELEIRSILGKTMERGKVSINIEFNFISNEQKKASIDHVLAKEYLAELKQLADDTKTDSSDLLKTVLEMPLVIDHNTRHSVDDKEWIAVMKVINEALNKCQEFRNSEGIALENKLLGYLDNIELKLNEVIKVDPERIKTVKERIKGHITEYLNEEDLDQNRFEQEMIFYIEKLDISEEKVRLKQHLNYFREIVAKSKNSGKKLGFISQEIGREINTIGSKANNAKIQRCVVDMKDELEKIKEQTLNIL